MRVLLDDCVPVQLARDLTGHDVQTVIGLDWSGSANGELLRRAAQAFDVFVTIGQLFAADQALPAGLALITLRASSNRIESLRPLAPSILAGLDAIKPGDRLRVAP